MSKIKQIITILITAIIFFVLGYLVSGGVGVIGENTFQAGWDSAEKRLAESGFSPMMGDVEIKSVNGTVEKIDGGKITLKIQPLNPLANPELDIRIIEVGDAKVYELLEKDQDEFQKEMEEFNKKIQKQMDNPEEALEPIFPPEFFSKQEINLSKVKVGQQITVIAGEDIKEVKQFKAVEITVQFMPVISQIMEDTLENPQMAEVEM